MNYELVNFCEFDKYATQSYCAIHNISEKKNLGDITKVNEKEISDFNMMVGGSPCQDFSVAGKQEGAKWTCQDCGYEYNPLEVHYTKRNKCPECESNNIEKTRSSLVVEWLRILLEKKPNVAIYENVKNLVSKKHKYFFDLFINELHEYNYNTYYKVLNAKDYGIPQNRERVYLIIIKKEFDNGEFKFPKGFDNGIRLKNILEKEVDKKYYISQEKTDKLIEQLKNKDRISYMKYSNTIPANYNNGIANDEIEKGRRQVIIEDHCIKQIGNIVDTGNFNNPQRGRIYSSYGICPALNTVGGGGQEPKILEDFYANRDVREYEEYSPTLRADRQGLKVVQYNRNDGIGDEIDCALCLTSSDWRGLNRNQNQNAVLIKDIYYRIRKLTPLECFRLMGFDDEDYNKCIKIGISNSQLYKQAGNSIVVDVLYYILLVLKNKMPYLFENLKLGSFFSGIGAFEKAIDRL